MDLEGFEEVPISVDLVLCFRFQQCYQEFQVYELNKYIWSLVYSCSFRKVLCISLDSDLPSAFKNSSLTMKYLFQRSHGGNGK